MHLNYIIHGGKCQEKAKGSDHIALGEKVFKLRSQKGITQDELAKRVGYKSRSTIAKIETGERNPDIMALKKLALILGCTTDYLLDISPVAPPERGAEK